MSSVLAIKLNQGDGLFIGGFALQFSPQQGPFHGESLQVWDTSALI